MKKLYFLFLLAFLPLLANADRVEIDGIYYNLNAENHTAEVTIKPGGYMEASAFSNYSGDMVIPETVTYEEVTYNVTSIGVRAISGCDVKSVVIPNSVITIGDNVFEQSRQLISVTIGNSVTSIGGNAFQDCSALTSITIPKSVTSIGDEILLRCSALTSIVVESENPNYDSRDNCNALIETASNTLINGCKNTVIANGVKVIAGSAFSYCSSLTSVTIPNSVTSIGNRAFIGCSGLTSVAIPNSVTSIGESAFGECVGMTSLGLGSGLTTIGSNAFYGCSGFTSVTIPASVLSIGEGALAGCIGLQSIQVESGNTKYDSRNNCNAIIETANNNLIIGCNKSVIPSSVTSIGKDAFKGCNELTSVTIASGITSIGEGAFSGCSGLASIVVEVGNPIYDSRNNCNAIIETASGVLLAGCKNTIIPDGVKTIGKNAISGCKDLTSISIPNSVTTIEQSAFSGCGLTSVTIPNSVNSIGKYAFQSCGSLSSLSIGINVTTINECAFDDCSSLTSITIPNSVATIGSEAFMNCGNVTTITIGSGIKSLGYLAFNTYKLTDVYCLAENLPTDNGAFTYSGIGNATLHVPVGSVDAYKAAMPWSGFKEVVAIDTKKTINVETSGTLPILISYAEKYSIEELTITGELNGSDIRLLRDMAGNNYKGEVTEGKLRVLDLSGASIVEGGDPYLESSSIKTNVGATMFPIYGSKYSTSKDVISYYMFAGCNCLQSVKLPAGITSIHFNGFAYCINMESISIFDKVTYLEISAFQDCRNLASIRIPKSVTKIYGANFSGCNSMSSIIVEEGNSQYDSRDNCNAVIETEENRLIIGCSATTIPNTVTTIGIQAFMGCQFTSISIPPSVKNIEYGAFDESALTSITIPSTVESIGIQIFRQCNQLTSIVVESGNPNYDSRENCNAIIETATNKLIATCSTTVVPSSVTALGEYTFQKCKELPVGLLEHVKIICDNAFYNARFASLVIPEGVESIGKEAFSISDLLKSVELPASLKSIGDNVFARCSRLEKIISHQTDPIEISDNVFGSMIWDYSTNQNVKLSSKATLYVPTGCKAAYEAAEYWKDFKEIIEMDETAPITIGKSGKASYCGDKSLDFSFSDEVKAYIATGFDKDEGTIWLTRVKDVPAGMPVLIKGEAKKTYNVPVTDSQNSYYTNMFVGNTTGATIQIHEKSDDGSKLNFYLKDGTFKSVSGNATIGNNKCYLQLPATFNDAVTGESQTVTIKASGKASFAAPVDLDFTNVEGLKAFTATGYDKSTKTIWLTRVMKVQRGEGVLLKGDPDNYMIPSAAAQSHYENMFVGNTSGNDMQIYETSGDGSQTNFYLKDGTFKSVSGNATIGNNKCYLVLPTSMVSGAASTRGAEANYILEEPEIIKMPISFRSIDNDGDGTTGIKDQSSKFNAPSDNAYYTLQGQRVEKPGKGLYIKNGKKIVIK